MLQHAHPMLQGARTLPGLFSGSMIAASEAEAFNCNAAKCMENDWGEVYCSFAGAAYNCVTDGEASRFCRARLSNSAGPGGKI